MSSCSTPFRMHLFVFCLTFMGQPDAHLFPHLAPRKAYNGVTSQHQCKLELESCEFRGLGKVPVFQEGELSRMEKRQTWTTQPT